MGCRPIHESMEALGLFTPRQRGFTLIELLVTIAIVAIASSLAAPSFQRLIATQRTKSAASALTESLWLARSEAIKRNKGDVGFTFTTATAGWDVVDDTPTKLHHQDGFSSVGSAIKSGGGVFTFNALGRLTAGAGQIELTGGSTGVVKCITVSPAGRTTVKDAAC